MVGAGSAGLVAALVASTARARVVLVERHKMGGDCLHTGCVPSKALIASAKTVQQLNEATNYGLRGVQGDVDFEAVMARVHRIIATIAPKDSIVRYESLGADPQPPLDSSHGPDDQLDSPRTGAPGDSATTPAPDRCRTTRRAGGAARAATAWASWARSAIPRPTPILSGI